MIAAAARQGVEVEMTEAEIILLYMENHGYDLLMGEEYALTLHDQTDGENHDADGEHTIRDVVELCKEMNEELMLDACSAREPDDETQLDLRKDRLILEGLMRRAADVVPPKFRRYNVAVIEHWRKIVPVVAASWSEAELKAEQMWKNGEITLSSDDFISVTVAQID